jgi:hypothetical protein
MEGPMKRKRVIKAKPKRLPAAKVWPGNMLKAKPRKKRKA